MIVFGLRKVLYPTFARQKRKLSKKKQRRETKEGFKQLKVKTEKITSKQRSSNAAPKKGSSLRLEVAAEVRRLEKEVAKKRADTRNMRRQLMEREAEVDASLEKAARLRTVNALLVLGSFRQKNLVNDLTRLFLG